MIDGMAKGAVSRGTEEQGGGYSGRQKRERNFCAIPRGAFGGCPRAADAYLVGGNKSKTAGQIAGGEEASGLCQHDVSIQESMCRRAACNGSFGIAA
jgi:hypothetical protein